MSRKKIVLAAGGTGGHLFPARNLAQELDGEVVFMAHGLQRSPFFDQSKYSFVDISAGPLSVKGLAPLARGVAQAIFHLRRMRPNVVVGFGSYHAAPVLAAATLLRLPIVLYEPNAYPGRVTRLFAKRAEAVTVSMPPAGRYLKGNVEVVTPPFCPLFKKESAALARAAFGLDPDRQTLLVLGGSQGADQVNLAALELVDASWQVIHLAGNPKRAAVIDKAYQSKGILAYVTGFEHRMDLAWSAATLSLSRAGAASLSEQLVMEVPGLLIPYPHAADNHQEKNADYFVTTIGGGVKVGDDLQKGTLDALASSREHHVEQMRNYKQQQKGSLKEIVWRTIS